MATTQTQARAGSSADRGGTANALAAQRSDRPLAAQDAFAWNSEPFGLLRRLSDDMDRLFSQFIGGGAGNRGRLALASPVVLAPPVDWVPSIEVFQRNGQLVVQAELPGVWAEDIDVVVADGLLTLSGERREEVETDRDGFRRTERRYGSFARSIALPEGARTEEIQASFRDGVLEITIPLAPPELHRRTIEIQGAAGNATVGGDSSAAARSGTRPQSATGEQSTADANPQ